MSKRVAILTGGTSSEREVALWSSENVFDALKDQFDVKKYDLPSELDQFLSERGQFDIVVPVFHGPWGEDGVIQGFLRTLNIPFIFSDLEAHAMGMNKALAKEVVAKVGINVAESYVMSASDITTYVHPVIIKPASGGSTLGISKATSEFEFEEGLSLAFDHADKIIVEDFIEGREFTVGVIEEGGEVIALPVAEVINDGLFDFDSKYTEGKMAEEVVPAEIDEELRDRLQADALLAHETIGARHLSRTDFIVDSENKIWFLEINTIPGMTKMSFIPKMLRASNRTLDDVLGGWINK